MGREIVNHNGYHPDEMGTKDLEQSRQIEAKLLILSMASYAAALPLELSDEHALAATMVIAGSGLLSRGLYLWHKDRNQVKEIEQQVQEDILKRKIVQFPPQQTPIKIPRNITHLHVDNVVNLATVRGPNPSNDQQ